MERHASRALRALLALVLVTPGLALGAVHPRVLAAYLVLGAALLALVAWRRDYLRDIRLDLPLLALVALAGYTAIQLVPLPAGLVRLLSPEAHAIRAASVAPLGLPAP